MLVTFSGLDGAGKTTQIERLGSRLEKHGKKIARLWGRGGYTPGFEWLKTFLRAVSGRRLPPPGKSSTREARISSPRIQKLWLTIALLDMIFYWGLYLRLRMLLGYVVICDRYIGDTYLDFLHNFPDSGFQNYWLWHILRRVVPVPDSSFVLWLPVSDALERLSEKNEPFPDDKATLAWRLKMYLDSDVFNETNNCKIDCRQDIEVISEKIYSQVSNHTAVKVGS